MAKIDVGPDLVDKLGRMRNLHYSAFTPSQLEVTQQRGTVELLDGGIPATPKSSPPANRRRYEGYLGLLILGLFLCPAPAEGQVSLVRVTPCGPGTFPATICTIPSTGTGNLIVIAWGANNGGGASTITGISDNAPGGTNGYTQIPGARSVDSTPNDNMDLWYAKNSKPGATTVTITPSASTSGTAVVWEFSGVDTVAPLDKAAVLNSQAATTTPSGAPVTISSANEAIVSAANVQGSVLGIHAGDAFTGDSTVNGNGWAHLITSTVGTYAPHWDNTVAGSYASSAASFKAAGSGGSGNPGGACDVNLDGTVNIVDVQLITNMYLGSVTCVGVCTSQAVQQVVNTALGSACLLHYVTLNWVASISPNISGYNIYRATTSGGPYAKLNSSLVVGLTYTDASALAGQTYYYVGTAVDINNTESGYSAQAQATVPSP
jgi:hypothetical protein